MCVNINSEKYRISQERQGADRGNSFVICNKEIKKFAEGKSPVTDKINNRKTDNRTQQAEYQSQFEIVFFKYYYGHSFSSLAFKT